MRWWISFEVDEAPRAGSPVGDAIQALYRAAHDHGYGTWQEGADAGLEPDKVIAYLEAWAGQMSTQKARWAAEWAANAISRAVQQPELLDHLPETVKVESPPEARVFGECSWHPGEYHGICSEAVR